LQLQSEQNIPKFSNIQQILFVRIFQFLFDHGNFEGLAGISPPQAVPLSWLVRPLDRLTQHPNKQTTSQFSDIQPIFLSRIFQFLLDHGHFLMASLRRDIVKKFSIHI
jgi:hypothetical protein